MLRRFTDAERRALVRMDSCPHPGEPEGAFGRGIGPKTLQRLIDLGFAKRAVDRFGDQGYAITEEGSAALGVGYYEE